MGRQMKLALTKTSVDSIPQLASGRLMYYDTKLTGFGLRVTPTGKVFFAEGRVAGKTVRPSIGRYGTFTVDQARDVARQLLSRMALGENPNQEKREKAATAAVKAQRGVTLIDAYNKFIAKKTGGQGKQLKPRTVEGYRWQMHHVFTDWFDKPVAEITEAMVNERHEKITRENGIYAANGSFRVLRTIINYTRESTRRADGSYLIPINPVEVLTRLELWNPEKRKARFVPSKSLEAWFDAVEELSPYDGFRSALQTRVALYIMIFLGFRSTETKTILLSEVELDPPSLRLVDTKNNEVHFVPMGNFLGGEVAKLYAKAKEAKSKYLLFSDESKTGHVIDIRKGIGNVAEAAKVEFSPHDLRRTFVSELNALEPAPSTYTIKRLMNHKMKPESDVTAGYIQFEEAMLRKVINRLEAWILAKARRAPNGQKLKTKPRQR